MNTPIRLPAEGGGAIARSGNETIYVASHGRGLYSFAAVQSELALGQIDAAGLQRLFEERWPGATLHYLSPDECGSAQMMDAILMTLEFGGRDA